MDQARIRELIRRIEDHSTYGVFAGRKLLSEDERVELLALLKACVERITRDE